VKNNCSPKVVNYIIHKIKDYMCLYTQGYLNLKQQKTNQLCQLEQLTLSWLITNKTENNRTTGSEPVTSEAP
jgi:hypothetical protein